MKRADTDGRSPTSSRRWTSSSCCSPATASTLASLVAYAKLDAGRPGPGEARRSTRSSRSCRCSTAIARRDLRRGRSRTCRSRTRQSGSGSDESPGGAVVIHNCPRRSPSALDFVRERNRMDWFMHHAVLIGLVGAGVAVAYGLYLTGWLLEAAGRQRADARDLARPSRRARRRTCASSTRRSRSSRSCRSSCSASTTSSAGAPRSAS